MSNEDKITKVAAKLLKARTLFHAKQFTKTGKHAHYVYFELSDFLPEAITAFGEVGLVGIVSFNRDDATLLIVDTESGERIAINSPMSEAHLTNCHPVQNLGAVQTYLRRYLWGAAMELVESDPVDSAPPSDDKREKAQEDVGRTPRAKSPAPATKTPPRGVQRKETASEEEVTEWRGWLTEVKMHDSKDNPKYTGKPYILYRVTMNDGKTATTFDEKLFTKAQFIATKDDEVIVKVTPNIRRAGTWEFLDIERAQSDESESELELAGAEKNEDPY